MGRGDETGHKYLHKSKGMHDYIPTGEAIISKQCLYVTEKSEVHVLVNQIEYFRIIGRDDVHFVQITSTRPLGLLFVIYSPT